VFGPEFQTPDMDLGLLADAKSLDVGSHICLSVQFGRIRTARLIQASFLYGKIPQQTR
jgi:hypothetical protein